LPTAVLLQVIGALGKGLAKLVFGGGSSHSKGKEGERNSSSPSPPSRDSYQQQQQQQQQQYSWLTPAERERAEQARTERERADYLASLDQRRGTHVAAATGSYDAYGRQDEGEDVPTAPKMVRRVNLQRACGETSTGLLTGLQRAVGHWRQARGRQYAHCTKDGQNLNMELSYK
jgi:hypothetical protein